MSLLAIFKKILKAFYPIVPIASIRRNILIMCGYKVGKQAYIPASFRISDIKSRRNNLIIGHRVSIGPNVLVITDSSPNNSKLLKIFPMVSKNVIIEDDVWIGARVTILPGVTIGKCSVVGSGSIVNKDIPEYSIAVGSPAKVIRKIDENEL